MSDTNNIIQSDWPRQGCIRFTVDKQGDGSNTTSQYQSIELAPIVETALDRNNSITRMEILSWPGKNQQEWILFPSSKSTTAVSTNEGDQTQEKDDEENTKPSSEREERDPFIGSLKNVLEEHNLPDWIGYDIADVDFAPIEQTLRPTCRLVVGKNPDLQPLSRKTPHPVISLIRDLNQQDIPYILQTIVSLGSGSSADYELSQRLAVYPPDYGIAVEQDFINFLTDGPVADLADYYDQTIDYIRSNFDLDAHDFFKIEGKGPNATIEKKSERGEATIQKAREILKGKTECHKLYAGYHATNQKLETLYRSRDYYTKLPISSGSLNAFLKLVPESITHTPWERIVYASPPALISRPEKLPEGELSSTSTPTPIERGDTTFATQGSAEHQFDEAFVAEYYRDHGFDIDRPDTDTQGSVPDLILQKDDRTYFAEVERTGTSRPANVLTNAARAEYYDIPVYFIVKDLSAARTLVNILRHPVSSNTDRGAQLYTQSTALTLSDGSKPLLPRDATQNASRWHLVTEPGNTEPTRRLELRVDSDTVSNEVTAAVTPDNHTDQVIAKGPVDKSVAEFEYATDIIPSGDSVPADRTRIHPPFVPTKLSYLTNTSVRYQQGNRELSPLEVNEYKPGWDYSDEDGVRKRYEAAFKQFAKQKLIRVEGAELLRDNVLDILLAELYDPQTTRKTPGKKEASRALWQHIDKKDNNPEGSSGMITKTNHHTWRWPREIEAPDLPFVGAKEETLLELI